MKLTTFKVIQRFNIVTKVHSITSDNAPNMTKALSEINDSDADFYIKPIRCACHIINLIVQVAFDEDTLENANKKIRYYCKRVHGSSVLKQYLSGQKLLSKEPNIKVELDISVRWNSTHDMLRTALRLQRSLTALSTYLVNEKNSTENVLTEIDWEVAKSTLFLLEPFNQGFVILI